MLSPSHSACQEQEHLKASGSHSLKATEDINLNTNADQNSDHSYHENCQKPSHFACLDNKHGSLLTVRLRKCQSLGNMLEEERKNFSPGESVEDEVLDSGFLFEYNQNKSMKRYASLDGTNTAEVQNNVNMKIYNQRDEELCSQHSEHSRGEPFAGQIYHEGLSPANTSGQFNREQHAGVIEQAYRNQFSLDNRHTLAKSHSLYNFLLHDEGSVAEPLSSGNVMPRSKSFQNLLPINDDNTKLFDVDRANSSSLLFNKQNNVVSHEFSCQEKDGKDWSINSEFGTQSVCKNNSPPYSNSPERFTFPNDVIRVDGVDDHERDNSSYEEPQCNNQSDDGYDHHQRRHEEHDSKQPELYSADNGKNLQESSSTESWKGLTSKEYSIRRIQDWINQIPIENNIVMEEPGECSNPVSSKDHYNITSTSSKIHTKSNLGSEISYKYISTMSPSSSTAHMANLGLVVIPALSAFVSLRMLNLSGNGIVRITAGNFPKGLQFLNLSRNSLSAIEGLRELTRLRVLDLSYNRISKLGHGLASCTSLKELYLAGNKISEVEGLHRLLKLTILDLHDNKISTLKGLGQLAANHTSLQAVNLDGNPAQKNVGDEQLKKYLLSILPRLVYYNKHAIRTGGFKEVADRPTWSLQSPKHIHRGVTSQRKSSSSHHSRSGHASSSSMKPSRGRHRHLPSPARSKAADYHPDAERKVLSFQPNIPMRRIQSTGAF